MTSEKIRIALVGCGSISRKHVVALRRIAEFEIVGLHDINVETASKFGEEFGIRSFSSMENLVSKVDPHMFDILTPSGLHGRNVLDLTKFNRHFVVEKPLALKLEEVDRIISECDQKGLRVYVVKQNRFNPPIQCLKMALNLGRFGKLVCGTVRVRWARDQAYYDAKSWRGTWALDGGVLTNQASHHIDMLIWLMGDVESVVAKTATRLVNIEAEDTGLAILKFRNGALGLIEATTATRPKDLEGSISVLGEKGSVEIGGFFMNEMKTWQFGDPHPMDDDVLPESRKVPDLLAWNHTEFFRDVAASYESGRKALIDGLEGRKSVELINAIYESAETGREIHLRFKPMRCKLGETND